MPKARNVPAFVLSILSGILLIISGTHGSMGIYGIILSVLAHFVEDALVLSILRIVAFILVFLASLGGFSVILGGYLVYKSQLKLGRFIIGLGAGFGIPGLLLTLFTLIVRQDVWAVIAQHGIIGWSDIALSLVARAIAK